MSKLAIDKISKVLVSLLEQAKAIDDSNAQTKAYNLRKEQLIFSESLFTCNSSYLAHYVLETQAKTKELQVLLNNKKNQFSFERLQRIERQIAAIINAIKANETQNKSTQQQLEAIKRRKYKRATQALIQPTQSLYQQLSETLEFERRLQTMLDEKQIELNMASSHLKPKKTDEILVLHQRLGRCRQAISKLERQIELSEKR